MVYSSLCKLFQQSPAITDIFIEVPSTVFELGFIDFLIQNRIDSYFAIDMLNYRLYDNIYLFNKFNKRINNEFILSIDGCILDKNNNYGENIDEYKDNLREDIIYFLGYLIGLNTLVKYKNNEKEFMKYFYNFLCMRKEQSFKESINTLGLNYDEFINSSLIKDYVKDKNKQLIKKYVK